MITLLSAIPWITLSYFRVFPVRSEYFLFFFSDSSHTCRFAHLPLPLHLISLPHPSCGVAQQSVVGPILFSLYATPVSSVISSSTVSHLLYANETQLLYPSPQKLSLRHRSSTVNSLLFRP